MKGWIFLLAASLLPLTSMAQINALPSVPHLLVKGHAEGRYVPDRFTISLAVEVVDKVPSRARAKVEVYMQQVYAALDKSGALPELTQASSYSVGSVTEDRDDEDVFVGTKVHRSVAATFDTAQKLERFLASVDANGELQISDTDVTRSDAEELKLDLRKRAIAHSRQSAEQIAAAYGMTLKGVYSVSEVGPSYPYGFNRSLAEITVSANALPAVALRVGTIKLEQDIYAVYLTAP